ncbi:hypothetical protein CL622_02585 [archaeon]|nr:hypothetical protein [archaeon]|tara:strand:- start:615 stop:1595 length:981 start_codon:yes stop_codon:yes gene_type:complete
MDITFHRGYTCYANGTDASVAIIAPHAGPAFRTVNSRDDNSETVASLCWRKTNGKLVVSNISRLRDWGVDFNRDIPPLNTALRMYHTFKEDVSSDEITTYKKQFGWVAKSEDDYYRRLRIYQNFWNEASDSKYIIMVHRAISRIKSVPSVMDVVTFIDEEKKKDAIKEIVSRVNTKYYAFLKSVEKTYKKFVLLEQERVISDLTKRHQSLILKNLPMADRELLEKDLDKIGKYSQKFVLKRLASTLTPQTFLGAAKHALRNIPTPQVTIENVFDGSLALGPKRKFFPKKGKVLIEVEPTYFMNRWYPETTAKIIVDVVNMLKEVYV